ncbi:hypothetical protein CK220_29905 [Mesorhizobium sp. WSM3860]|nr:hypothetical protein CK220_29905 [Mesorhizobium sp. WSM3860]
MIEQSPLQVIKKWKPCLASIAAGNNYFGNAIESALKALGSHWPKTWRVRLHCSAIYSVRVRSTQVL